MDKYKLRMKFERSHFTDADNNVTGEITQDYAEYLENELLKAINYTRCSIKLPDVDKRKEIEEEAYTLNLQNLSGREDFEKAFRIGIMTGIDETIEYIESKAIV